MQDLTAKILQLYSLTPTDANMQPTNLTHAIEHAIKSNAAKGAEINFVYTDLMEGKDEGESADENSDISNTAGKSTNVRTPKHAKSNDTPEVVMGDAVLLESLFGNLVSNAVDACFAGGVVNVSLAKLCPTRAVVCVSDTGCGMTSDVLAHISEPFVRADAARSRQHGGTGLGLALCEKIAHLHQTRLAYSSKAGEGTAVEIEFTLL